jgi:hypothetical protein
LNFKSANDYFTILDLNDYPLERISEMLDTIVEHNRTDHKNVELILDNSYLEFSNNNINPLAGKLNKIITKKHIKKK